VSVYDEARERFNRLRSRVDHRLTYDRTEEPRFFYADALMGPDIPDAFGDGMSAGEWCAEDHPSEDDPTIAEEDWFAHFAHMAVAEGVHEVLEWFKVDGEPWLNPHGIFETHIHRRVEAFWKELVALRARTLELNEAHRRETTTLDGRYLIADCSCGETYTVLAYPRVPDELKALDEGLYDHIADVAGRDEG
jgi:hypothetical protein